MRLLPPSLLPAALAALASLAACSSGGHSPAPACQPTIAVPQGTPFAPSSADCSAAPAVPAGRPFTLAGLVTYDFVPARYDPSTWTGGLDFAAVEQRPVRDAQVQVRQCSSVSATGPVFDVLATVTTGPDGRYSATFTPGASGRVFVTVLARTSTPEIQVQDNTDGNAIWALAKPLDTPSSTLDLRATHGFDGCAYGAWRTAAPFAILDSMYTASRRLLDLPRDVPFPALSVNWSPLNRPSRTYVPASGAIVTSHYDPQSRQIFILGADGMDTDEFDNQVIVHEWGHYFDDNLSRSDSPGGWHTIGDVLDPRLSFGEGFASAFAAMLLDQRVYADTYWGGAGLDAFGWDVETPPGAWNDDPLPGPFSELSVIRTVWDLYDPANESSDTAAFGLAPIYDTLVGPQRTTPALTTLASFVAGLRAQPGVTAGPLDAVLASRSIGAITSEFGDGDPDLRAMFEPVTGYPYTSPPVTFDSRLGCNMRGQNQYFVLTAPGTSVTVTTQSAYDVDVYAYRAGVGSGASAGPSGEEVLTIGTDPGEVYVVVLNGWEGNDADCLPVYPLRGSGLYTATISFATP